MELSVKDTAQYFNVPEKIIYRWISEKGLPAIRVHHQYRFNRTDLMEWAAKTGTAISPDVLHESKESHLPGLAETLKAGGIYYGLEGSGKMSVLRAVVETIALPEETDREYLLQVLLAREDMGTTAFGDGIAIPHVRSPIVLHMPRPMIALCFLKRPVDFDALDGKPVATVFTLISTTVRIHLHLLSRLGFILKDPDIKSALERQAPAEELLDAVNRAELTLPLAAAHG